MRRDSSAQIAREGVTQTQSVVQQLGWIFREQTVDDYGVDAHVEIVDVGVVTGRLLALQIKSGTSFFREGAPGGWWFRPESRHVNYWLAHSLPVVVVLHRPEDGLCFWQLVSDETLVDVEGGGRKLLVPESQVLDADSREVLLTAAMRGGRDWPESPEEMLQRVSEPAGAAPIIIDLSSSPPKLAEAYRSLSPLGHALVQDAIGASPSRETVAGVIAEPSPAIVGAGDDEWRVLALEAERTGGWLAAARAWEQVAARVSQDEVKVKVLGHAAAAAGVGGDATMQADLQGSARRIAPTHPRVVLMDLSDEMGAVEQLELLRDVRSDDPDIESLINGHRALAHFRRGDMASAGRCVKLAEELAPTTLMVRMLHVNLAVQQARLDLRDHRPLQAADLGSAIAEAAAVRGQFLAQRRYGEAVRMLMLEADALLLLEDRAGAIKRLNEVTAEELAEPDGPEVLGESALRALDFRLALQLTEAAPASEAIERIRAAAYLWVGDATQKTVAVETLDRLVAGEGPEAEQAAWLRLHAALSSNEVPWSGAARQCLVNAGFLSEATILEASHIALRRHDVQGAMVLLEEHGDAAWARVWAMRLAVRHNQEPAVLREAADRVMAAGPAQTIRLECGRVYSAIGDLPRAEEVLVSVAHDQSGPLATRTDAFNLLVQLTGRQQNDWDRAAAYLKDWQTLNPGDPRASMWAPSVANRRRHR